MVGTGGFCSTFPIRPKAGTGSPVVDPVLTNPYFFIMPSRCSGVHVVRNCFPEMIYSQYELGRTYCIIIIDGFHIGFLLEMKLLTQILAVIAVPELENNK